MWTPEDAGSLSWDDLRKQARRLESELDVKLSSFRRGEQRDGAEEAEIERLLQRLNDVNVQMQTWVSNAGSDVLSHTLARHLNILHELSQEFARIRVSTKASREHAELLQYFGGADESKSFLDDRGGVQSLLREQATINRSSAQMDSVIGHAQEAYTALRYQRSTFGDISSKIGALRTKMPSVNKVLTAIRRRKSRDTLVIGAVTSLCLITLLLWLANHLSQSSASDICQLETAKLMSVLSYSSTGDSEADVNNQIGTKVDETISVWDLHWSPLSSPLVFL